MTYEEVSRWPSNNFKMIHQDVCVRMHMHTHMHTGVSETERESKYNKKPGKFREE